MDYTEVSNSNRMMMKAQGIDEMYIDKEETLYYDESGNIKLKMASSMQIQILYLCWVVFRQMILFLWKS